MRKFAETNENNHIYPTNESISYPRRKPRDVSFSQTTTFPSSSSSSQCPERKTSKSPIGVNTLNEREEVQKKTRTRPLYRTLSRSSSVNRKSSFLENLLAMSMRSSPRWCINNTQEPVEARAARIKSHNALVQTNARWQCYGVREFTTLKSGEHSEERWERRRRWRREKEREKEREREREREAGVAQEERSSRVGTPLERTPLV